MPFARVTWIWKRKTYFFTWLFTTLMVGWLYMGRLTDPGEYDVMGWVFALVFPVLVGAAVAVQVANYREQKGCPLDATGGGIGGTFLGIVTVACPACPAVLLGWIGLAAAIPGSLLASPWLKLASLALLGVALFSASKNK